MLVDAAKDALLDHVADNSDAVDICTADPANYAGISAVSVASYAVTAGDGNGDWTIDDGATDGRELNLGAQTGNNGTATGAANYLAAHDGSTTLYYIWIVTGKQH